MWAYLEHYETLGKNRNVISLTLNLNDIILNQYRDPKLRSQLLQAKVISMSIHTDLLAIALVLVVSDEKGYSTHIFGIANYIAITLYRYC